MGATSITNFSGGSGGLTVSAGTTTLASTSVVSGNQTWTNNSASTLAVNAVDTSAFILSIGGTGDTTISSSVSGAGGLIKIGAGTLTLPATNSNTGETAINQGTIAYSSTTVSPGSLAFGSTNAIATVGILNLSTASATFSGGFSVRTNNAAVNTLNIGVGQTLTINGDVQIGSSTGGSSTSLTASGGGTLTVNNSVVAGIFAVGGITTGGNTTSADFNGLNALTINLPGASLIRVNPNVAGSAAAARFSVLTLPSTGASPTAILTAGTLAIGDDGSFQTANTAGQNNSLRMGSGVNTINVNVINIGTGVRDLGRLQFNAGGGSVVVRGQTGGTSQAVLNIATGTATSSQAGGAVNSNSFDVSGHTADLRFSTITIGTQPREGNNTSNFFFDTGTLDAITLTAASRSGTSNPNGTNNVTTVNVTFGGGTTTISGPVLFGQNTANAGSALGTLNINGAGAIVTLATGITLGVETSTGGIGTGTGTLNITNGTVNIGGHGGIAVNLAITTTAGGTANGTLNISGGTVTLGGSILDTNGAGTDNSTVTLSGGTVNMGGFGIVELNVFTFTGGTLANPGTITQFAAATFAQTASVAPSLLRADVGNNTLISSGAFTANGVPANLATVRIDGTFSATGGITLGSTGLARLQGTGSVGSNLTVGAFGTLHPGNSPGILTRTSGTTTFVAGGTFAVELNGTVAGNTATNHGQLVLTSGASINVTNATLSASLGYTPADGQILFIIRNGAGAGGVTGNFTSLAPDAEVFNAAQTGVPGLQGYIAYGPTRARCR